MLHFDNNKHNLSFELMDSHHKNFIEIYNSIKGNSAKEYQDVMVQILEQTKNHFAEEEEQMDKYNYPRSVEHKDEHKKVLSEMEYFIAKSTSPIGSQLLKSYYLEKLPHWFDLHLISMDSDLASFLKKQ